MTETTTPNAIETRTNSHLLMGKGTVCNPNKLPKGKLFVSGAPWDAQGNPTGLRRVVCNKCNKVNPRGL